MQIREYHERDLDALRSIHAAQDFDYALPDLRNPLFVTKLVLAQDPAPSHECEGTIDRDPADAADRDSDNLATASHEKILGAALLRLTAEAYLLLDPRAGTLRERWQWLLALHEAAKRDA